MRKRFIAFLAAAAAGWVFGAIPCFAGNPYVGIHAGAAFLQNLEIGAATTEHDAGLAIGWTTGYDFGKARVEGEFTYLKNDVARIRNSGRASGDIESISIMANGFYDIETASAVTPYVGGGIGVVNTLFNKVRPADARNTGGGLIDDDDWGAAVQFATGLAFKVTRSVDLDLGYRMLLVPMTFRDQFGNENDDDYLSHTLSVGVRMNF